MSSINVVFNKALKFIMFRQFSVFNAIHLHGCRECILNNILKYMYSKKNIGKILKCIRHMEIDEYVIKR